MPRAQFAVGFATTLRVVGRRQLWKASTKAKIVLLCHPITGMLEGLRIQPTPSQFFIDRNPMKNTACAGNDLEHDIFKAIIMRQLHGKKRFPGRRAPGTVDKEMPFYSPLTVACVTILKILPGT